MFGDNPKRTIIKGDGKSLFVQKIFKTIQGEGPNVGLPAIFIRLGGCNLACSFCDTEFEDFQENELDDIVDCTVSLSKNAKHYRKTLLVVISGGEPMRQPIELLCQELIARGFHVQIETNGTIMRNLPKEVEIICSPKVINGKYHQIRPDLLARIQALKFIVSENVMGYNAVPELGQSDFNIAVFVQPMDQYEPTINATNTALALKIVAEYGYRLSLQTHKIVGIE